MIAFLDTEFTDLMVWPRLLSVGLVTDDATSREFYAEVTDSHRIQSASRFAARAVLCQFGAVNGAACTYAALGTRLSAFIDGLTTELDTDRTVEIAYSHDLDWELLERAIVDSGAGQWTSTRCRLRPVNVYDTTGFGPGRLAAEAYFSSQSGAPLSRHHALCDARALRVAHAASASSCADETPTSTLSSGGHTVGRNAPDHRDARSTTPGAR